MLYNIKQLSMRIIIPLILMIQSINTYSQNSEYIYYKQSLVEKIISVYKLSRSLKTLKKTINKKFF